MLSQKSKARTENDRRLRFDASGVLVRCHSRRGQKNSIWASKRIREILIKKIDITLRKTDTSLIQIVQKCPKIVSSRPVGPLDRQR